MKTFSTIGKLNRTVEKKTMRQKNKSAVNLVLTRHSIKVVHRLGQEAKRREAERERRAKIRALTRERVRRSRLKKKLLVRHQIITGRLLQLFVT